MRIGTYRVTRKDIDRLMAIPEARMVLEAKFAQVWMLYVGDLVALESNGPDPEFETGSLTAAGNDPKIIRLSAVDSSDPGGDEADVENLTRIVDASRYRYASEAERVRVFMDYFNNHLGIRKAVLDEFFMRILPFSGAAANVV